MLKVPFAWDLRKLSFQAAAAAGAANIVQQDIDISEWALSTANKFLDSHQKATALSSIARELGDSAYDDQAMQLLVEAFSTARLAGKETVLKVLADGADILAKVDQGETLLKIYEEFLGVDHWPALFTAPR